MFLLQMILIVGFLYGIVCLVAYGMQERLIFHPDVLPNDFVFEFEGNFDELFIEVAEGIQLNALHFKAKNPKGIVFYVHGNAGSLYDWGSLSSFYRSLDYDLLMFDYRGFGKSNGKIRNQQQFFADVQVMYDYTKTLYAESNIIVEGFSIGTATAAKIATENQPRHLVLKAPYYSLPHLIKSIHPYLPARLVKYSFRTIDFLKKVTCSVTIFHGTIDELIPISNAELLSKEVPSVEFIAVPHCQHNDLPYKKAYQDRMRTLLI